MQKFWVFWTVVFLSASCTKEDTIIYVPDPNEEKASTAPLVTVIYDANALGDHSYNDLIYEGVERSAQELGLRTMQMSPQTTEEGLQYLELMFRQMESARDSICSIWRRLHRWRGRARRSSSPITVPCTRAAGSTLSPRGSVPC